MCERIENILEDYGKKRGMEKNGPENGAKVEFSATENEALSNFRALFEFSEKFPEFQGDFRNLYGGLLSSNFCELSENFIAENLVPIWGNSPKNEDNSVGKLLKNGVVWQKLAEFDGFSADFFEILYTIHVEYRLPTANNCKFFEFSANGGEIVGITLSKNGEYAAVCHDSVVDVWKLRSDVPFPTLLETKQLPQFCLPFPKEGAKLLKSIGADKRENKLTLHGHSDDVYEAKFVCGNSVANTVPQYVLSGSDDATVRLFEIQSQGANLFTYSGHRAAVFRVDVFEKANKFASGSLDRKACFFDFEYTQPLRVLPHDDTVSSVKVYGNNGEMLCAGLADNSLQLWDLRQAAKIGSFSPEFLTHGIGQLGISRDEKVLLATDYKGLLAGLDLVAGKMFEISKENGQNHWHTDRVNTMLFTDTGDLVSCSNEGSVCVSEISRDKIVAKERFLAKNGKPVFDVIFPPLFDAESVVQYVAAQPYQ